MFSALKPNLLSHWSHDLQGSVEGCEEEFKDSGKELCGLLRWVCHDETTKS